MKRQHSFFALLTAVVLSSTFSGAAFDPDNFKTTDTLYKVSDRLLEEYGVSRE